MDKKTAYLTIFLLLVAAFLGGSSLAKVKYSEERYLGEKIKQGSGAPPTQPPFNPPKTQKPEVKFYVMSFCPYGNQAEEGLEPVYQLLKNKVNWQPRYVIYPDYCANVPSDQKTQCEANYCYKEKGKIYCSMHGLGELNQDVREICAFGQAQLSSNLSSMDKWWKFVLLVNSKCTSQDVDQCWLGLAKEAGLDTSQIISCAQKQKAALLSKEVEESTKDNANGSPMVFINGSLYNGGRAPEDYKKAICSAFEKEPEECGRILGKESAGAAGGCN